MNVVDLGGVNAALRKVGWTSGTPTSEGPKEVHSIYPSLEELRKTEGKHYDQIPHPEWPGVVAKQINYHKD